MHMVKRGVTRAAMVGCAVFLALLGIQSQELRAYEVQPVSNGGMLQGTVKLKGEAPAPKQFELRRYPDRTFCGALSDGSGYRLLREVNVGQAGGLKDVVVVIEDISQGKPFAAVEAQVEANVCQFFPFVTIVAQQQGITVTNRDPVFHDIQGYTYDQAGIDIVLHRPSLKATGTTEMVKLVKGRKVFTMQCGMHPYMQNWGYAIDNPYYAVTNLNGSFAIVDLPAGTYRIKAWHPILGAQERELTVKPNETVSLDLSFGAK